MTIGPEMVAPDVLEPVVGFRTFGLDRYSQHNYRLVSPYQRQPWLTADVEARCTTELKVPEGIVLPGPLKPHDAPAKDCGCGIYAYFKPCPVRNRDAWGWSMHFDPNQLAAEVEGLVTLSGRLEVHSRGMRAQRARICALGLNETLTDDTRAALYRIAEQLGVPVVPQDQLPALASEFGRPLPESMRPTADDQPPPDPAHPSVPAVPSAASYFYATASNPGAVIARPERKRYQPEPWTVWFNLLLAAGQAGAWAAWHSPINLVAMAISASTAAWYAGRRSQAAAT